MKRHNNVDFEALSHPCRAEVECALKEVNYGEHDYTIADSAKIHAVVDECSVLG